ncbi:MAG: glutathione S-transferase [Myxococcota bacterium]|nr:glutathione S-transferase [Myxococcota bacterium]
MKLYGWPVSPYTQKVKSYLLTRRIPFEDVVPTGAMLRRTIQGAVGRVIMPTVQHDGGGWLQDSSVIIDWMEAHHPGDSISPPGPRQRLAALLVELYADEWLPMAALHYRWNIEENAAFVRAEFARYALPWLPGMLGRRLIEPMAGKMSGYLPLLGVTPETIPGLEASTEALIAGLDVHLREHDFLLGGRPCIGDFALYGPLWAHLFRDPGSRWLLDDAPSVRAWMERLTTPAPLSGSFRADDVVPESLDFLFRDLFAEQWPYIASIHRAITSWLVDHPAAERLPRSLGTTDFTLGGRVGQRKLITAAAWMAQRPLDALAADRTASTAWLERVGGAEFLHTTAPARQIQRDFRLVLA